LFVDIGLTTQGVIRHRFEFWLQPIDLRDQWLEFLELPVVFRAENLLGDAEHEMS